MPEAVTYLEGSPVPELRSRFPTEGSPHPSSLAVYQLLLLVRNVFDLMHSRNKVYCRVACVAGSIIYPGRTLRMP